MYPFKAPEKCILEIVGTLACSFDESDLSPLSSLLSTHPRTAASKLRASWRVCVWAPLFALKLDIEAIPGKKNTLTLNRAFKSRVRLSSSLTHRAICFLSLPFVLLPPGHRQVCAGELLAHPRERGLLCPLAHP